MSDALVVSVHARPWKPCVNCNGMGILIGRFDPELGHRPVKECPKCDGWGIKINRPLEKALVSLASHDIHQSNQP